MTNYKSAISLFFFSPIVSGLAGFGVFLLILIAIKLLARLFNLFSFFSIETEDILMSLIGFAIFSVSKFIENFKEEKF